MAISFNQIPILLRTPGAYSEYDNSRAVQGISALPNKVLLIGAMETGEATAGVHYPISSKDDGPRLFGRGSQLAAMVDAFKRANALTECWAVGLADDGGATAKVFELTFGGTATEAGSVKLMVAGRQIIVPVAVGDDDEDVATAVAAAIAADTDNHFTAAVDGVDANVVDATARAAGLWTNGLDIRVNYYDKETLPAGITLSIASDVAGATDPDLTATLDAIPESSWYTKIVSGFSGSTAISDLDTFAEAHWGPLVQQDVMCYVGIVGNYSTVQSVGAALNSKFVCAVDVGQSPTPAHSVAAVVAAVDAAEPDPARPRQTLVLPNVLAPGRSQQRSQAQRNLLLQAGIATVKHDASGKTYIERLITTYQTNANSVEDVSYLDVTTMHTLAALRYTMNARIQLKYPRHKLASDGTIVSPGQPIVTPKVIRGELIALFDQWAEQGWVEAGAKPQFMAELVVERNASDVNRVDAIIPPDFMNQFIVFASQIQFLL